MTLSPAPHTAPGSTGTTGRGAQRLDWSWLGLVPFAVYALLAGVAAISRSRARRRPGGGGPPVTGRWLAMNSPGDRVAVVAHVARDG